MHISEAVADIWAMVFVPKMDGSMSHKKPGSTAHAECFSKAGSLDEFHCILHLA